MLLPRRSACERTRKDRALLKDVERGEIAITAHEHTGRLNERICEEGASCSILCRCSDMNSPDHQLQLLIRSKEDEGQGLSIAAVHFGSILAISYYFATRSADWRLKLVFKGCMLQSFPFWLLGSQSLVIWPCHVQSLQSLSPSLFSSCS